MAGSSFLRARAPVTPNSTSTQGPATRGRRLSRGSRSGLSTFSIRDICGLRPAFWLDRWADSCPTSPSSLAEERPAHPSAVTAGEVAPRPSCVSGHRRADDHSPGTITSCTIFPPPARNTPSRAPALRIVPFSDHVIPSRYDTPVRSFQPAYVHGAEQPVDTSKADQP